MWKNQVVKLEALNGEITLTRTTPEVGKVVELLEGFEKEGEDIKISFSYKYVGDALKSLAPADQITLSFTTAMRPFLIHGDGDESVTQLILPVRTE